MTLNLRDLSSYAGNKPTYDEDIRRRLSAIADIGTQQTSFVAQDAAAKAALAERQRLQNAMNSVGSIPNPSYTAGGISPAQQVSYNGDRVNVGGNLLDRDTWNRMQAAFKAAGIAGTVTQGSWSSKYKQSKGTHLGAGTADLIISNWGQAAAMEKALRQAGLVAWHRTPNQGFQNHFHIVNPAMYKYLQSSTQGQVNAFLRGLNGLTGNGRDTGYRDQALINAIRDLVFGTRR